MEKTKTLHNDLSEIEVAEANGIPLFDRKKAETILKENEFQLRHIIQNLPAAFYITDKEGYIIFYNDAAAALWGRKPEIGKDKWCGSFKIFALDGTTEVPLDESPMALALKEKRKALLNKSLIVERPDGTRRYFIPHPDPIFDTDENLTGAMNMLVDVTESKTNEERGAMLAAIVHSSNDAIISKTLNSVITSWNEAAERMFGYTTGEMIGQSIYKIIPDDRKNEETDIINKIKKGELVDHFQTKRLTKKGKLIDISLTISPIKDPDGRIIGASKIARDITKQKKAERIIHEKDEHLRMAIESAKLGTWEYDPINSILKCSEESKKMCGLAPGIDPDFQLITEHIYEEDKNLFFEQIKKAVDSDDGKFDLELRIHRYSDKQIKWIHAQGIVFFNSTGQPEKLIGILLDITDEKQKEKELRNSMEMFQIMANNVPAMIWMSGNDTFSDYFNKTWLQFTGRTQQQEENEGWLDNVYPDDMQKCISTYNESLKDQKGFYAEYRLRRHDGEYRWVADNAVPRFSPDGDFIGFISACIDIHETKMHEQRKDDFIKMASHELKTPITSINGYVQLLLNIYNEEKTDNAQAKNIIKTSLQTIQKQVSKLTRLIAELLDLSKIESGRLDLRKTEFTLEELIEEAVQEARLVTSQHAIIFRSDFDGRIIADRDRIGQVLSNLLLNAIKYSPDASMVEVHLKINHQFASVDIKDHGIGIDKKDHKKIFERFYRVEGKEEQTYPGFGIGLFIAHEIVQRHQGTIAVKSEKNKGATFTVTLPIASENKF